MNIGQKILTVIFLILFLLGTIVAIDDRDSKLQNCIIAWVLLGVIYAGLFFVCATRRK